LLENIPGVRHCYSNFPITIDPQEYGREKDQVYQELKEMNILPRRYFYPFISQFPAYKELESSKPEHLPVAQRIASEVLCLPLYPDPNRRRSSVSSVTCRNHPAIDL
jgi:dTDP-4-amino-4,6-dideoxygalactose transaminase